MPRKRKRIDEPKEAMAQRLSDDSRWTLEDFMRMTVVEINGHLRDLGLHTQMKMTRMTEEDNGGQSWVV